MTRNQMDHTPGDPGAVKGNHELCRRNTETGRLDEEAVWNALIQPVTILQGDMRDQVRARARPDLNCADYTGVVTCSSQAVHILEQRKEWTLIEAYSSADQTSDVRIYADRFQGYVQTGLLREAEVDQTYGLVIDKCLQRMYVFWDGKLFTTLSVSTGLAAEAASSLETPAGEFLIVSWEGDFWAGSYFCGYGMRINKSIFLHQVPGILRTDASTGREYLDYATCESRLGKKDSHGCIRV